MRGHTHRDAVQCLGGAVLGESGRGRELLGLEGFEAGHRLAVRGVRGERGLRGLGSGRDGCRERLRGLLMESRVRELGSRFRDVNSGVRELGDLGRRLGRVDSVRALVGELRRGRVPCLRGVCGREVRNRSEALRGRQVLDVGQDLRRGGLVRGCVGRVCLPGVPVALGVVRRLEGVRNLGGRREGRRVRSLRNLRAVQGGCGLGSLGACRFLGAGEPSATWNAWGSAAASAN